MAWMFVYEYYYEKGKGRGSLQSGKRSGNGSDPQRR